jgi:DNA mismatch repair protein MutS
MDIHLHRMGDFYEAFDNEAAVMAKALDIVLTKRNGRLMAGIPMHCADSWVTDLVKQGHKVLIHEKAVNK